MKLIKKTLFTFLTAFTLAACLKATPVLAADEVNIPDANLRQAILTELGKSSDYTLNTSDMKSVKYLNYYEAETNDDEKITSLEGIQYCTNLSSLNLSNNLIEDISPLKELVNLKYLILDNNKITDLSSLTSLEKLTTANVDDQKITLPSENTYDKNNYTIKNPLVDKFNNTVTNLTNISNSGSYDTESNNLCWNNLADTNNLSFSFSSDYHAGRVRYSFSGTASKQVNYLEKSNITDVNLRAAINKALGKKEDDILLKKELLNLKSLDIDNNGIISLAGIEDCKNLQYLSANSNKITDISPLSKCTALKSLHLAYNSIYDLSYLSSLPNLSYAYAADQKITLPAETFKDKYCYRLTNPLRNKFGEAVRDIYRISNNGNFSTETNHLWWNNLADTNNLSFSFESDYHVGNVKFLFSGIVNKTITYKNN